MADLHSPSPVLQFDKLEQTSTSDSCKACRQPITGVYYRSNGAMLCGSCADRIKRERPADSHAAFVRASLFGAGGFLLGLILYAGFTIITGIEIGYVSLAVGFIVGKAMIFGSRGIGGRRYQIAAVLLTYAAVSMASIPIALHYIDKEKSSTPAASQQSGGEQQSQVSQPEQTSSASGDNRPKMTLAGALSKLAIIGLASPFLQLEDGFSGIIGLVILFVGLQFAWKITAGTTSITVDGPYELSSSASA
jgi:hypothetical protein